MVRINTLKVNFLFSNFKNTLCTKKNRSEFAEGNSRNLKRKQKVFKKKTNLSHVNER